MNIGTTKDGKTLKVDLQRLLETRLLIQSNSGGGKSWAVRRLLEQAHGKVQQLVLDPEGEFASLRERFDYVYAAKQGGDTAADPRTAKLLAQRLLELGVSAIIDIYELRYHDRIRFVRAFFEALVDAPKALWHPALVVLDEAHVYCPQKGEAESAGAVIDGATRFRKRGYGLVLATQRLSKLHKDAAAELNNKLIGRSALDVDMKRAAEELGFTSREEQHHLRTLHPGDFFCFGPALCDTVTAVRVGEVQTSHPKAGERAAAPPPPREKVQKVLAQLADLPKEAEQERRTVADLQAQVRELERQSRQAAADLKRGIVAPDPMLLAKTFDEGRKEGRLEIEAEKARVGIAADNIAKRLKKVTGLLVQARTIIATAEEVVGPQGTPEVPTYMAVVGKMQEKETRAKHYGMGIPLDLPKPKPDAVWSHIKPRPVAPANDQVGNGGLRRILIALAQCPQGLNPRQIGVRAGLSSKSGSFSTYLSTARRNGWIEGSGVLDITQAGLQALGDYDALPEGRALLDHWLGELGGSGAARMLRAVADAHPNSLTPAELGAAAGLSHTSGSFSTYLSKLRTLELVEGRGTITLSGDLA